MNDKHCEYHGVLRDPETIRAQLPVFEKEIIDLRYKIEEKAEQYRPSPQVK